MSSWQEYKKENGYSQTTNKSNSYQTSGKASSSWQKYKEDEEERLRKLREEREAQQREEQKKQQEESQRQQEEQKREEEQNKQEVLPKANEENSNKYTIEANNKKIEDLQKQLQSAGNNVNKVRELGTQIKNLKDENDKLQNPEKYQTDVSRTFENLGLGLKKGLMDFSDNANRIMENRWDNQILEEQTGKTQKEMYKDILGEASDKDLFGRNKVEQEEKWINEKNRIKNKMASNIEHSDTVIGKKLTELAPSLGQQIPGIVLPGPVGLTYFTGSATEAYRDEAKERGITGTKADVYSGLMGAFEGLTDAIGGSLTKSVYKNFVKGTTKEALKSFGLDVLENFAEEAIMEPINETTATLTGGKDKANWDNMVQRMLSSGFDGALSGIIMAGTSAGIGKAVNVTTKLNNNQQVSSQEIVDAVNETIKSDKVNQEELKTIIKENTSEIINRELQNNEVNIEDIDWIDGSEGQYSKQIENNIETKVELDKILNNKDLPMQGYKYETSDNVKINQLRQQANQYFNNSQEAHKFVEMLEKIITDKDIEIRLDANLKTADGRMVNGSYSNGVITINPNSTRTGEFIAIHELTHAIGTDSMKNIVETYRKSNKDFDTAVEKLLQNYKSTEITEEALSDVSAQLFGNQEFINNIANTNPGFFKKIYNEIKYLWHQFRGYKNQNQFIEDLYYKWTQAYNSNNKLNGENNFSIQIDNNGNKYVKVDTDQDIFEGIDKKDYNKIAKMYIQDYLMGKTQLSDNDITIIDRKSANKYTNPGKKQQNFDKKMQLTPELKNVLEIAQKDNTSLPTKDTSKYQNWEYYKFIFELSGKNFEGTVNIGIDSNGNKHFYEINKIKEVDDISGTSLNRSTTSSINNSITSQNNDVNTTTKYSMQESENNSGSFNLQKNRFDVSGNENLVNAQTLFYRTREDGLYYVQATDGSGKITYDGVFYGEKQLARSLGEEIANKIVNTSESTNNEIYLQSDNIKSETDYMMAHRPTETGAYASNITKGTGEWESLMPEDVYEHPEWYFDMNQEYSKESFKVLKQIKNNPNAEITIYRATTGNKINKGDWVTLSKKYAEYHNNSQFNGKGNIVELKVKAKDVQYAGDDINEFGYFPQANTQTTDNPDIRFSQSNETWQKYLDKNFNSTGTRTNLKDIGVNVAPTAKNNVAPSMENNMLPIAESIIQKGEKQRKHYKSIMQSKYSSNEARTISKELMGTDTYVPESNNKQLERADERISIAGADSELNSLMSRAMTGGNIKADDIAVGERLIQYYSKIGNKEKLSEAIQATAMAGTTAGQTVQAMSLLNHQTPEGQAIWLQRSIEKMNNKLKSQRGDRSEQFKLTPEMTEKIVNSKNTEELQNNLNEVYEELGQQVSKSAIQKIDAWRYFAMLANPKTHIRNIVGNTAMSGAQSVKNKVAGVIEGTIAKFNPKMERNHTINPVSKEVKEFAKSDIINVADRLGLNQNKYNPKTRLENSMRTFKSDAMENTMGKAFDLNDKALEAEDGWGLKSAYTRALSEYMTSNKLKPNTITDEKLSKARNYAIEQAKEATFHQESNLATLLNQLSNKNNFTKFVMDATLPFKKTPINVAKAGLEYSPVGLVKSAVYDTAQLRKGNITINKYIDNISKGLTGTGIALVGYALASCGVLKASGSDDKDKEGFDEVRGNQTYSIKIGDNTYSLDWLSPVGIPLFIGAECYEIGQEAKKENTSSSDEDSMYNKIVESATNVLDSFTNAMNPMTEMSMLSGLTSAIKSYDGDNSKMLANIGVNAGKSYINQFVPTALSQIARTTDKYERNTISTKTGTLPKAIDSSKNYIMSKIPGLRQILPKKTDVWGNEVKQSENVLLRATENSLFPWTRKEISTNNVDNAILKVYESTGDNSVFPDSINKNMTINSKKYVMTSGEYAKYQQQYGKTSYTLLNNLVNSSSYKKMSEEQKQKSIENAYSYAKEQIKIDYAKQNKLEYEESTLSKTINAIKKVGGNTGNYLEYTALTKDLKKDSEKIELLANANYSINTKKAIYENTLGEDDITYKIVKYSFTESGLNISKYLNYKNQELSADRKDDGTVNGQPISGSKKTKVLNYIKNIPGATNTQKLLLYALQYEPDTRAEKQQVVNYIDSLTGYTNEEKLELLSKFKGVTIYKNGKYEY